MAESPDKLQVTAEELRDEVVTALADLVMSRDALKFGKLPGKSSKAPPYQIDTSELCLGKDTFTLGRAYAITIDNQFASSVDVCLGAPGKGAVMAAFASFYYGHMANFEVEWAFPQQISHKGADNIVICGAELTPEKKVLIIDDLLTDGQSIRDMIELVRKVGCDIVGVCVLIDRRDRTKANRLVVTDLERETGVKILSCCTLADLVKKMPDSYLSAEKRDIITRHVTVDSGSLVLPPNPPYPKFPDYL